MHWTLRLAGILMPLSILYYFWVPDAKGFMSPGLARVVFVHLPCAFLTVVFLLVAGWHAVMYFRKPSADRDHRLGAAVELTTLLSVLTMATGIFFSKVQWGEWWHWDPRQTSFLIVLLLFGGAIAIRSGFEDETKRAKATAGYVLAILLPVLFLTFVFPNLPEVKQMSMHPSDTIVKGKMDNNYKTGYLMMFLILGAVSAGIYQMRVRVELLLDKVSNRDGLDEAGRSGAPTDRVVRPVALHDED